MAKTKRPAESISGRYSGIPHAVMDSAAFLGATLPARALLFELMRQHTGGNNGHLQLATSWLRKRGWTSAGTVQRYKAELLERGLMLKTRLGGLNAGADLYALTWLPISNFVGLDITARQYHPGAWAVCNLPPTQKRKPPARKHETPSDHRNGTVPTIGIVATNAVPTIGTKTPLSAEPAVPITGNNESYQFPTRKRIVGKPRKRTASEATAPDPWTKFSMPRRYKLTRRVAHWG